MEFINLYDHSMSVDDQCHRKKMVRFDRPGITQRRRTLWDRGTRPIFGPGDTITSRPALPHYL